MRFLLSLLMVSLAAGLVTAGDYEALVHTGRGDAHMPYRLLKPDGYDRTRKYPLVLALHGWGERGTDNKAQLKHFGALLARPTVRKKFPAFVVLPQANGSWIQHPVFDKPIPLSDRPTKNLTLAIDIVDTLLKNEAVDANRIYLIGYSNGACGVWELLERYPKRWAAAAPMAGAADPTRVRAAKDVPVWAFHGANDKTIPLERMTELTTSLREAGGTPLFTIVPKGVHWMAVTGGLAEPNLLPWMFAQRRGRPAVPFDKIARPKDKRPTSLQK
jgi:predicted peptidase